jgi:hypothetical protein
LAVVAAAAVEILLRLRLLCPVAVVAGVHLGRSASTRLLIWGRLNLTAWVLGGRLARLGQVLPGALADRVVHHPSAGTS